MLASTSAAHALGALRLSILKLFLGVSCLSVCLSVISKCTETFGLETFYVAGVLMCVEERCHCAVVCFEKLPELWQPDESD